MKPEVTVTLLIVGDDGNALYFVDGKRARMKPPPGRLPGESVTVPIVRLSANGPLFALIPLEEL